MSNMDEIKAYQKHDLSFFSLKDMAECGAVLRNIGAGAASMEETAERITRYLYEKLSDRETGGKACALVRFFKTHSYDGLDNELRSSADSILGQQPESPNMKCLTLLATAGDKLEWNSRMDSAGHKAIPLPSEEIVNKIPMIVNLIRQLGPDVSSVINPNPEIMLDIEEKSFNVFHVADAAGSPFIPAQDNFVVPYGIRSVLGVGGIFSMGDIFTVIIFSKVPISRQTAGMFRTLALNMKMAVMPFETRVFRKNRE